MNNPRFCMVCWHSVSQIV